MRALRQFRLEGFKVNLPFLQTLVGSQDFQDASLTTRYIDLNLASLVSEEASDSASGKAGLAGTKLNTKDPLAVLALGKSDAPSQTQEATTLSAIVDGPAGTTAVPAPLQGTIIELLVSEGTLVFAGQELVVMDAMKMEHVIQAPVPGEVAMITAEAGDAIVEDHPILFIAEQEGIEGETQQTEELDLDYIRPDLAEAMTRHGYKLDQNREAAVARRRKTSHRTVRENVEDVCDPGTFIEYGSLTIAAQRRRRTVQDLMENTPGDGMVTGIGSVNQNLFPDQETQCVVMSYDYMVLAGTQGLQNHRKKDRMFEVAEQPQLQLFFSLKAVVVALGIRMALASLVLIAWHSSYTAQ